MNKKIVALTFDDGPSNITSKVLDILEKERITASFFLIGNNISDSSEPIIKRQIGMGCEICNHSLTHSDMTTLSASEIVNEIEVTSSKIEKITGKKPCFFRPPFISVDDKMYQNIKLPFICGIDSKDWDSEVSSEERIHNILSSVRDGAIILMHDFTDNDKTVNALPKLIFELKNQGYEFVTISELFIIKNVDPMVSNFIWSFAE